MLDLAAGIWNACLSKETVLTSFSAAVLHGTCARGDVVLLASAVQEFEAGEVLYFLSCHGQDKCVVQVLTLAERFECHAVWHESSQQVAIPLTSIFTAVTWASSPKGITTLIPFSWR
jgi:hypothetical protein